MPRHCGAKTRAGGECKAPAMANGRCRVHGGASTGPNTPNTALNAVTHGFYSDALLPEERLLWERAPIGSVDDEIRLAKVKLHRLVRLSGSADVADLVESALEVTRKLGEQFDHEIKAVAPYDKLELSAKAARYGDLIAQALDQIRKLELARAQLRVAERKLQAEEGASNDDITGFEVVPYED